MPFYDRLGLFQSLPQLNEKAYQQTLADLIQRGALSRDSDGPAAQNDRYKQPAAR